MTVNPKPNPFAPSPRTQLTQVLMAAGAVTLLGFMYWRIRTGLSASRIDLDYRIFTQGEHAALMLSGLKLTALISALSSLLALSLGLSVGLSRLSRNHATRLASTTYTEVVPADIAACAPSQCFVDPSITPPPGAQRSSAWAMSPLSSGTTSASRKPKTSVRKRRPAGASW